MSALLSTLTTRSRVQHNAALFLAGGKLAHISETLANGEHADKQPSSKDRTLCMSTLTPAGRNI